MVAESSVRLIPPSEIERNPENPRLIFREDELQSLEDSIAEQGILVPLTVYETGHGFVILDGERRWRCALKLNLPTVPAIVQSEPDLVTNIMMMFAIHKGRSDWDPLPTALKLGKLERILTEKHGRPPKENELAAAASLSRGEIRRYRNILALPDKYKDMLLTELELPRAKQVLTVDHVLETTRAAEALWQRDIVDDEQHDTLVDALIDKFRQRIIKSTVDPRLLVRISRAVDRDELELKTAKKVSLKLISSPNYTIKQAFADSVERIDFEHGTEQLSTRTINRLQEHLSRNYELGDSLRESLIELRKLISRILSSGRS
jgi:ParB family transcriptional regulator, chromosome partitioning protein